MAGEGAEPVCPPETPAACQTGSLTTGHRKVQLPMLALWGGKKVRLPLQRGVRAQRNRRWVHLPQNRKRAGERRLKCMVKPYEYSN